MKDVLAAIDETGSRYVFRCPGCDTWHEVETCAHPGRPCWQVSGPLDCPTVRPAVLVNPDNVPGVHRCHAFITAGRIAFLPDSTHALAGQSLWLRPALSL